jgi:hypothetical protein
MVICFECDADTKRILDRLLGGGRYRDYSEVISVALANQSLLQEKIATQGAGIVGAQETAERATPPQKQDRKQLAAAAPETTRVPVIPRIFLMPDRKATREIVPMPPDNVRDGLGVPIENWIFGQYNRFLPLKVSCRALANLAAKFPLDNYETTAREIASEAESLGGYLLGYDLEHSLPRDDRLSTAFPLPGPLSHKSRERYATQFVVSVNTSGQASSLLVDFKFIGFTQSKHPHLSLTEPALHFALLENPVLDQVQQGPLQKFSAKERDFLVEHILSYVPKERSAYRTILAATVKGQNTPDKLEAALGAYVRKKDSYTPAFLAAQRSGAISRMADLGLLVRVREGVRVSYEPTPEGKEFLKRTK